MEEPFQIGRPVLPPYFIDREKELDQLHKLLGAVKRGAATNVALIGLRRTGKTSILENLFKRLEKDREIVCVDIDCYGMPSKTMFSETFVKRVTESYASKTGDRAFADKIKIYLKEKISAILERISELEVSVQEYIRFNIKLGEQDEEEILESAMTYPEILAKEKGIFFIIALDEFQDLIEWGEPFLKKLRSMIQKQKRVAYIFTGSITTIMNDLVYRRSSPFYRQLLVMHAKQLPTRDVKKFFSDRIKIRGSQAQPSAVERVVALTGCFPEYVQRLGIKIVYKYADKKEIDSNDVDAAFEDMVLELDGEFLNFFKRIPMQQREILISISKGKTSPSQIARDIRKPLTSISPQLTRILNLGILEKLDNGYRISDPVFQAWLEKRY